MRTLVDCTALIVEDETILALDLFEALSEAGFGTIHIASNEAAARLMIHKHKPHVAVLDINLGSHASYPIADMLALHRTPFIFVTAEPPENVPQRHRERPLLKKPYPVRDVVKVLLEVLSRDGRLDTSAAPQIDIEHADQLAGDKKPSGSASPDE